MSVSFFLSLILSFSFVSPVSAYSSYPRRPRLISSASTHGEATTELWERVGETYERWSSFGGEGDMRWSGMVRRSPTSGDPRRVEHLQAAPRLRRTARSDVNPSSCPPSPRLRRKISRSRHGAMRDPAMSQCKIRSWRHPLLRFASVVTPWLCESWSLAAVEGSSTGRRRGAEASDAGERKKRERDRTQSRGLPTRSVGDGAVVQKVGASLQLGPE